MTYAKDTGVSIDKSKAEIERDLSRYGGEGFGYWVEPRGAIVQFRMRDKLIKMTLRLPDKNSEEFTLTPSRKWQRTSDDAYKAWEQACRQKWRALALVVKAKLEAIEAGISTLEEEFLPFIVLPDGQRVGDVLLPQIEQAYLTGEMPPMLMLTEETEC